METLPITSADIPAIVKKVMPKHQQKAILGNTELFDKLEELRNEIKNVPKLYAQDGKGKNAIVYLHYFYGGSDWFITEYSPEENSFFGYVVLNNDCDMAEFGYIPVDELVNHGRIELDFYWRKKSLKECLVRVKCEEEEEEVIATKNNKQGLEDLLLGLGWRLRYGAYFKAISSDIHVEAKYNEHTKEYELRGFKRAENPEESSNITEFFSSAEDLLAYVDKLSENKPEPNNSPEKTFGFELLINDNWFRDNPTKILGEEYQSTDRFGKPVTKVRGTIEVLQGIDAPDVQPAIQHNPIATEIKPEPVVLSPEVEANIRKAVNRTEKQIAELAIQEVYGARPDFLTSFDEILEEYNPGISKEEIAAWIWYRRQKGDPMAGNWLAYDTIKNESDIRQLVEKGIICYTGSEYQPAVLFYAGSINEKLEALDRNQEAVKKEFGEETYHKQREGLLAVLPPRLSVIDPIEANRLVLSPVSRFAREEFRVTELADGTEFTDGSKSLKYAFAKWLYSLTSDDFEGKTSAYEINNFYLGDARFPRGTEAEEKAEIKKNIRMIGNKLFSRFLFEGITREDQKKLEFMWNARYNSYVDVNYNKVPVGFACSKTFKNKPLFIRPAQREGIAFNSVNGTSIIAFDVGVGKTLTLILGIAQRMQEGGCKRPLIVVPNQTAKKWVAEIEGAKDKAGNIIASGLLPQYKVLNLFNLGEDYLAKIRDGNGKIQPVEENTITVVTYEGFKRLAFGLETENTLIDTFTEILNQGIDDARDAAKLVEKVRELIGLGLKDSVVDVEELGFDYLAVDEAHSMKKVFTKVKGEVSDKGREKAQYAIDSGEPSALALKGFMMAYYIMHGNGNNKRSGTNVTLLTATPFTNSPLEIYSMLALVGYKELKRLGINNITEFFDTFVNESYELKFNARQEFEMAPVIKSFNNRIVLQNLIYKFISYKTGEEANIERPNKIVLPLLNEVINGQAIPLPEDKQVSTFLQPTQLQRQLFNDIKAYVRGEAELDDICNPSGNMDDGETEGSGGGEKVNISKLSKDEEDKARSLRAINYARQVAVSPYLYACAALGTPTPQEYIESSPVLQYTMECIRSVKAWHEDKKEPVSGQVIYMNAGVGYFPLIKKYLIDNVGYKSEEVEIISSGISITKKEKVKEEFLAGNIKIIIGSATIKEGIDLQNRSTVLYNCWVDWNPTDMKQLEGRIWRFGNQFDTVRIVMPLVEDSIHIFLFQKLEEKTSRINDIWFRAGRENVLPLEDVNPEELKLGLLSDPKELAEFTIEEEVKKVTYQKSIAEGKIKTLDILDQAKKVFAEAMQYFESMIPTVRNQEPALAEFDITDERSIMKFFTRYLKNRYNHWMQTKLDNFQKATRIMEKAQKTVLQPNDLTIADDLKPLIEKYQAEIVAHDAEIARIKDQENKDRIIAEFVHKKENNQLRSRPLAQRIAEFTKLNYLLGIKKVYRQNSEPKKVAEKQPEPDNSAKVKALARAKALILIAKAKLKLQKAA